MTSDTMSRPDQPNSMSFWLFDFLPSYCTSTSLTATCSVICKDVRLPLQWGLCELLRCSSQNTRTATTMDRCLATTAHLNKNDVYRYELTHSI